MSKQTFGSFSLTSSGSLATKALAISGTITEGMTLKSVKLTIKAANAQGSAYVLTSTNVNSQLKKWNTGTVTVELPTLLTQTIYIGFDAATGTGKQTRSFSNIEVEFEEEIADTACEAPTEFAINVSSVISGRNITLNWSGAKAGVNHPISGYRILCNQSDGIISSREWYPIKDADGNEIGNIVSTETSGSLTFDPVEAIRQANPDEPQDKDWSGAVLKYSIQTLTQNMDYISGARNSLTVKVLATFEQQPVQLVPPYRTVHIWRRVK